MKLVSLGEVGFQVRDQAVLNKTRTYELWSIPACEGGVPEVVAGQVIGSSKFSLQLNDVLVSKINPRINRVWIVSRDFSNHEQIGSTEWIVYRPDSEKILPRFAMHFFRSPEVRSLMIENTTGATGSHTRARVDVLLGHKIPLPSLEKQREIVEKLDSAFAEIDLLEENLRSSEIKTNELLQSLLSSAFSSDKAQIDFTKVFTVIPDSKSKIKSSSYLESGKYSVVDQGKELVAGYTDTPPTVEKKSLPVIVFGDHTRAVKYIDFPFTAGADGTQILKPSALTDPKYGFYLVLHAVGQIPSKGYARHFGELKKMQFQLPSLPEQRKIVEKLDSVFAQIELLKAQIKIEQDHATALRQSLLRAAFNQEKEVA